MPSDSSSGMNGISIASAVAHVRAEIETAMKEGIGKKVRFRADEVSIELNVSFSESLEAKAGVKVWVAQAGGATKRDDTTTHKVTLKMKIEGSNLIADDDVPQRGAAT